MRKDGRTNCQLRPVKITLNPFGYAHGSVFFEQGETKIYVCITINDGVPKFLKGKKRGWLTAEYAMHPCSTSDGRTNREVVSTHPNKRNIEIARLIGRCARSVVDMDVLGERTINIDCDVLQADGGTRCASLTAVGIALQLAEEKWTSKGKFHMPFINHKLAAVSVGIIDGKCFLDLNQEEDNRCDADFNFVITDSQQLVEIQGTAENYPMQWVHFDELKALAIKGVEKIFDACNKELTKD